MDALKFNPQIFTISYVGFHGTTEWDLLTVDGEDPNNTVYFMRKGDVVSSGEMATFEEMLEKRDWERRLLDESEISDFMIDPSYFEASGFGYTEILAKTKELAGFKS